MFFKTLALTALAAFANGHGNHDHYVGGHSHGPHQGYQSDYNISDAAYRGQTGHSQGHSAHGHGQGSHHGHGHGHAKGHSHGSSYGAGSNAYGYAKAQGGYQDKKTSEYSRAGTVKFPGYKGPTVQQSAAARHSYEHSKAAAPDLSEYSYAGSQTRRHEVTIHSYHPNALIKNPHEHKHGHDVYGTSALETTKNNRKNPYAAQTNDYNYAGHGKYGLNSGYGHTVQASSHVSQTGKYDPYKQTYDQGHGHSSHGHGHSSTGHGHSSHGHGHSSTGHGHSSHGHGHGHVYSGAQDGKGSYSGQKYGYGSSNPYSAQNAHKKNGHATTGHSHGYGHTGHGYGHTGHGYGHTGTGYGHSSHGHGHGHVYSGAQDGKGSYSGQKYGYGSSNPYSAQNAHKKNGYATHGHGQSHGYGGHGYGGHGYGGHGYGNGHGYTSAPSVYKTT